MRRLRLSLVGVSVIVLVTAFVASVWAQSPMPGGDWTFVTGFEKDAACAAVAGEICATEDMDDPRVSGDVRLTVDMDCSPETAEGDFCWMGGDIVITNEGGTWEGRWVGIRWQDGLHEMTGWFSGTGAYEGWSYVQVVSTDVAPPEPGVLTRSRGVLYHGDLPPSVALDR